MVATDFSVLWIGKHVRRFVFWLRVEALEVFLEQNTNFTLGPGLSRLDAQTLTVSPLSQSASVILTVSTFN
jgi:hypothetical protein